MAQDAAGGARPGVLSLSIKEKAALYAAYMPFVKHGGLFIPTTRPYKLGDDVYMLISLMEDPARMPVAGKVVWITPAGAQGGKTQGIGVEFQDNENSKVLKSKIEALVAGYMKSNRPTHTM